MAKNLELGWLLDQSEKVLEIPTKSIAHHTAILAQSGAGKSFFLGRFIEEILLKTRARVLILDANGDFRNVHQAGSKAWDKNEKKTGWEPLSSNDYTTKNDFKKDWQGRVNILQATFSQTNIPPGAIKPLVKWRTLDTQQQAEILDVGVTYDTSELYPVLGMLRLIALSKNTAISPYELAQELQPDKFIKSFTEAVKTTGKKALLTAAVKALIGTFPFISPHLIDILKKQEDKRQANEKEEAKKLEDSAKKLGQLLRKVQQLDIWSDKDSGPCIKEIVKNQIPRKDLVVIDLPSISTCTARPVVVNYALDAIWEAAIEDWDKTFAQPPEKDKRVPLIIVVDEAHNLIPAEGANPLVERVSQNLMKFAAEGRKYGVFLILATQRPAKLKLGLLAECENLCLLRLQSPIEHKIIVDTWGLSPNELARVRHFKKGDALLFGNWSPSAITFHSTYRRTKEGGANLQEKYWTCKRTRLPKK